MLSIQIKTIFNMVPFDIIDWCMRDTSKKLRFFTPLQLLMGHSQSDFKYTNPKFILESIQSRDSQSKKEYDYQYMSIIERVLGHDENRVSHLRKIGLMNQPKEICYDFHQSNCLERCFVGDNIVQNISSADVLIKHLMSFPHTEIFSQRNMLVNILPQISDNDKMKGAKSKEYINFFLNHPVQDEGDLEITQKFE